MSKKAAEHHTKAAEHHEHAAKHHREAAKHHTAGHHEKAAHHAHMAHGHMHHATHHSAEAAKGHAEEHGNKSSLQTSRVILVSLPCLKKAQRKSEKWSQPLQSERRLFRLPSSALPGEREVWPAGWQHPPAISCAEPCRSLHVVG